MPPSIGGGVIQKDSESKDSLSIPHFISVTVNKYPGQNNNDNNNNNNNFGGKRICFSSQVQVTAQWCREGKVTRTQSYWLHHTQESRAERNERMLAGSLTCLCLLGLNSWLWWSLGPSAWGMVLPTVDWVFLHELTQIKTIPHWHLDKLVQCRQSLIEILFPSDSRLHGVNRTG